jgi:hypothetical protein
MSNTDDIRKQEDKVKRIYSDIYNYVDNNNVMTFNNINGKKTVKIGTNYTYTLNKNDDGTYSYKKSSTKK